MKPLPLITGIGLAAAAVGVVAMGLHTFLPAGTDLKSYQDWRRSAVMRADVDRDRKVSRAEWSAAGAELLGRFDVGPGQADAVFAHIDADHDGLISLAEIDAATRSRFARYDLDHNGVLNAAEAGRMRPRPSSSPSASSGA